MFLASRPADAVYPLVVAHDGIGQTTRAGRYRVLHTTVEAVFDRLAADYDAVVVTLASNDQKFRLQRLVPASTNAAPITVAFDDFPGVSIRFGRWYVENLPTCGCDYCNEDEDRLARDLQDRIEAVARGGFTEHVSGNEVIGEFQQLGDNPQRWSRSSGDRDQSAGPSADGLPEPPTRGWLPWPRRGAEIHRG